MYSVVYTVLYSVVYTVLYSVQCSLYCAVHCTVYSVVYTVLYSVHYKEIVLAKSGFEQTQRIFGNNFSQSWLLRNLLEISPKPSF